MTLCAHDGLTSLLCTYAHVVYLQRHSGTVFCTFDLLDHCFHRLLRDQPLVSPLTLRVGVAGQDACDLSAFLLLAASPLAAPGALLSYK